MWMDVYYGLTILYSFQRRNRILFMVYCTDTVSSWLHSVSGMKSDELGKIWKQVLIVLRII